MLPSRATEVAARHVGSMLSIADWSIFTHSAGRMMLKIKEFQLEAKAPLPDNLIDYYELDEDSISGDINPVDKPIAPPKQLSIDEEYLNGLFQVGSTGCYDTYCASPVFPTVQYEKKLFTRVDGLFCRETSTVYRPQLKGVMNGVVGYIATVLRYPTNGQTKLLLYMNNKFVIANIKSFKIQGEAADKEWAVVQSKLRKAVTVVDEDDVKPKSTTPARRTVEVLDDVEENPPKRQKRDHSKVDELKKKVTDLKKRTKQQLHQASEELKTARHEQHVLEDKLAAAAEEISELQAQLQVRDIDLAAAQKTSQKNLKAANAARDRVKQLEEEIKVAKAAPSQQTDRMDPLTAKIAYQYVPVPMSVHGATYPSYSAPPPTGHMWPTQPMPFFPPHFNTK